MLYDPIIQSNINEGTKMLESKVKLRIKKLRLRTNMTLLGAILLCLISNYFLIEGQIEQRLTMGLSAPETNFGFIWGSIILLPFVVLNSCIYIIEQTLLDTDDNTRD